MPSDASQRISGIVMMPCAAEPWSMTPSSTATPEAVAKGPPMSPNMAMPRGTRPDRNIRYPKIRPFPMPTTKPGPSRNVQLFIATSDSPTGTREAASPPAWRKRQDREDIDDADGDKRVLGQTGCHVPEGERFVLPPEDREQPEGGADVGDDEEELEEGAQGYLRVRPGTDDVVGVVQYRAVEKSSRDRGDKSEDEQDADDERRPSRVAHVTPSGTQLPQSRSL